MLGFKWTLKFILDFEVRGFHRDFRNVPVTPPWRTGVVPRTFDDKLMHEKAEPMMVHEKRESHSTSVGEETIPAGALSRHTRKLYSSNRTPRQEVEARRNTPFEGASAR